MSDFNWDDHPVVNEKSKGFSWDDHPVVKPASDSWLDTKLPGNTTPRGFIKGGLDALPVVTGAAGGIVGSGLGPVGAVGGAGLGYAGGKELADVAKNRLLGEAPQSVDPLDAAKRVSGNALTGAEQEMGGQVLGVLGDKAGQALKNVAEEKAFKSLGGLKAANDQALARGNVNEIGRQALDEGVVTPIASKQTMLDRVGDKVSEKSSALKDAISAVMKGDGLSEEQQAILEQAKFDPKSVAERLKGQLRVDNSQLPEAVLEPRLKGIDSWLDGAPKDIQATQDYKTQMQKFIKDPSYWKGNPNASQQDLMSIRRAAKEAIENMGDKYADMAGGSAGEIKGINRSMGNNLQMEDILEDSVARGNANQSFGLGDKSVSAGGAAAFGPKGLALGFANKLAREKGNQVVAPGADALSKMLMQSPQFSSMAQNNPAAFKGMVSSLGQKMSESAASRFGNAASTEHAPSSDQAHYDPSGERAMDPEAGKEKFLEGN